MKPRRLLLQAFGPFAERETIDFTRLPDDALFLIHGPTGAGKSTLLDGICYALYGETSGDERQPKEMRSHHAADSLSTEVELDFDLGAQRYRIRRVPEQERAALRGAGKTVKVPARSELYHWQAEDWQLLATKSTEVTAHIVALLGFEAAQFRQVILLPQGQFRKLLAADSKDREKILETLFGTEQFKRLQERLQTRARDLEAQAGAFQQQRAALLQQAEVESAEALAALIAADGDALAALDSHLARQRDTLTRAEQAYAAGQALAGQFDEHAAAAAALAQLALATADIARQRQQLADAQRAQGIAPLWSQRADTQQQADTARQRLANAHADSARAQQSLSAAQQQLAAAEARAPEQDTIARHIAQLEEAQAAARRLASADFSRQSAQQAQTQAQATLAAAEQQLRSLTERRSARQYQIDTLTPVAARSEALQLQQAQQLQQQTLRQQLAASRTELAQHTRAEQRATAMLQQAQAALEQARASAAALEQQWRDGQAAALAQHLAEGAPCPVCGNCSHPAPAHGQTALPDQAALPAAQQRVAEAETALETARQAQQTHARQCAASAATLAAQQAGLADASITPEQSAAALAASQAALAEAQRATTQLAKFRQQAAQDDSALNASQQQRDAAQAALAAATAQCAAAESLWQERAAALPEALRDPQHVDAALKAAQAQRSALQQQLQTARERQQTAASQHAAAQAAAATLQQADHESRQRLAAAITAWQQALIEHAFADEAAFASARLPADAQARLAQHIRQHEEQQAAAQARRERAAAALVGQHPPDLEALQTRQQQARAALETVLNERQRVHAKQQERQRSAALLADIAARLGDIEQRYRHFGHLADIANGRNGANLTFQRYVLASLLDDVLQQANLRLLRMTGQRYRLQRSQSVGDKRRAAGLDIEVFDEQTGTARSANTLSGGEGFMASLSLALGLSDVVQAYAGGIALDALFIDEGFGTLDPEALDMALKTLIDLQQKGRLIGIISHVGELKHQLAHGIEVRFAAGGSRTRVGRIGVGGSNW